MLKTLFKLSISVLLEQCGKQPPTMRKTFSALLWVFSATPKVVSNSVGNGFKDAFPSNSRSSHSSTQNELNIKKMSFILKVSKMFLSFLKNFKRSSFFVRRLGLKDNSVLLILNASLFPLFDLKLICASSFEQVSPPPIGF